MNKTFKNLTIIELASVLAGPSVGSFFAELGATVIKIENKLTGGDVTRQWKLPEEVNNKTVSAYYAAANTNKKVLFKNLQNTTDRNSVLALIKKKQTQNLYMPT